MKTKILLLICLLISATINLFAQVKIGNNPNSINANSLFEMESTNKGFLPPRVVLNSTSSVSPLTGTVPAGMFVYSTGGSLSDGFYYWNSTAWQSLVTSNSAWGVIGNAGTNYTNFIGTSDNASLRFRTNNTEQLTIDSTGKIGMGITTPKTLLHLHNPTISSGSYPLIQLSTGFTGSTSTDGFVIGIEKVSSNYNVQFKTLETGNIEFYGGNSEALYIKSTGYVGIGNSASSPKSTLQVGGSFGLSIITKTSDYTASGTDITILCNTGAMIVNLPQASTVTGRIYVIKKISNSAGTITITPYNGTEYIDGLTTNTTINSQYDFVMIQSNGSNWYIISKSN